VVVVDTNVVAYALIEGPKTVLAQTVREKDSRWRLPELWRHEFLNVLAMHARHGGVSLKEADVLWQEALALLTDCELPVDMRKALRASTQFGISAYDAQYIALAQSLGVRCVTEDRRLARAFPDVATSMDAFCSS
jgi:predicted nucleic acid-binding protein